MARERLPDRRKAETVDLHYGGRRYHLTIGEYPDGSPGEVFVHGATPGSDSGELLAYYSDEVFDHANEIAASIYRIMAELAPVSPTAND